MGKSVGKFKKITLIQDRYGNPIENEEVISKRKYCQDNFVEVLRKADDSLLLEIGGLVCGTDYAVRFYKNKVHPKFYKNREQLEHAIRRSFAMNAFNHRETILDYLQDLV